MMNPIESMDVIVIGAGAAGLMAAHMAGARGKRVILVEHTDKIGEKIRISGGGRCNFTNLGCTPANFISQNAHFAKSALAGFTQHDFIKMVEAHAIPYHEKTLGQLFCDGSAKQIISMFLGLCEKNHVQIKRNCTVIHVTKKDVFCVETSAGTYTCNSLIVATGGLSIPQMGATDFGYTLAKQFGLKIVPTRPALVPLTVAPDQKNLFAALSGVSLTAEVSYGKTAFKEGILFTHRGLSGPAILQISSYLPRFKGEQIKLDLLPHLDLREQMMLDRLSKQMPASYLKAHLPNRWVDHCLLQMAFEKSMTDMKKDQLLAIAARVNDFTVTLESSEGYAKAEVTVGGVDTRGLSSKTMEVLTVPGLFFVGEVVDVTGWLGGYNFQWAWSSGYAAGKAC